MPATTQDYSQIKVNQEKAASLNREAAGMTSTAFTLPDTIMNAVREDRTARGVSKLATDTGNVMGQMVTDPNAIRGVQEQGLMDPFSVNALTSNARAQNLSTLGTISTQLSQNQGSLDEVINAGANQLKARAAQLLAEAENATAQANILQQEWERARQEKADEAAANYNPFAGLDLGGLTNTPVDDGFVEDKEDVVSPQNNFNFGGAVKALVPQYISDPIGWAKEQARSRAVPTLLNMGLNYLTSKKKEKK